jgi:acyl-CoA synthetase (AMP-forming)/AMP-acid ligase II
MQVTQSLHRALQQRPDARLTVFRHRVRTVAESFDRVARLAGALREVGVRSGDRVGMLALNSDRYHEYLLAVPWAGGVVNPVNIRWSAAEIAYSLADCQTDVLLADDAFAGLVPELRRLHPGLREVIFCGDAETPDETLSYESLVSLADPVPDALRADADLYGIFYTGGTTGHPKGVMLSHRAVLTSAMGSLVSTQCLARGGVLLHAAPMFHLADIAAWNIGMLTGSAHVIVPSFTPAGVVSAITKHGVTDALLVPTMIQMLVDSPDAAAADLSGIQKVLYGASPISEAVLRRARATLPNAEFTQAYGMTEVAPVATLLTEADHRDPSLTRSCGRAAAHCEVKIVDPLDAEVPAGTVGEIVVRGDNLMAGYWNKPSESADALRGGWMHTGDGGFMDARGYVFVVDRLKDMIITGGENVYSVEVENALVSHPCVAAAAVVGAPDEQWGERVHAFVVLRPGTSATDAGLAQHCRALIASYKVPRGFTFLDALPLSGAGKVLKRELRKQFWAGQDRAVH